MMTIAPVAETTRVKTQLEMSQLIFLKMEKHITPCETHPSSRAKACRVHWKRKIQASNAWLCNRCADSHSDIWKGVLSLPAGLFRLQVLGLHQIIPSSMGAMGKEATAGYQSQRLCLHCRSPWAIFFFGPPVYSYF